MELTKENPKKPWSAIMQSFAYLKAKSAYMLDNAALMQTAQKPFCHKIAEAKNISPEQTCLEAYDNCIAFLEKNLQSSNFPNCLRGEAETSLANLKAQKMMLYPVPHA